MKLTIDFDNMSRSKFKRKLKLLAFLFPYNWINVLRSSSRKGYHVEVWNVCSDWDENLQLRKMLGDDLFRVLMDRKRSEQGIVSQLLFDVKKGEKAIPLC